MIFYDSVNKRAICQEIDRLCDSDDTSYPRVDKTSRVNDALEEVVTWIIQADGTWQFDDNNYTTLPRGTGTLIEGQAQYSFASEYLDIIEVEILDNNGLYRKIEPFDPSEFGDLSWDQYFGVDGSGNPKTGWPRVYDKTADGLRLGPAPTATTCTLTAGIRVTFQRTAQLFTVATDTSTDSTAPGFASPFHVVLAYMAAIPYCMSYKPARIAALIAKVGDSDPSTGMKRQILTFYSNREHDVRKQMTSKRPRGFR